MKATPGTGHRCVKRLPVLLPLKRMRDHSRTRTASGSLIQHIAVWESVGRRRLEGDRAAIEISSPADWPPADDTTEAAWEQAKAALDRGHQALREAIARVSEERIDEPILEGLSTVYVTLHGVIQHDLYHAGQIAMLKKAL